MFYVVGLGNPGDKYKNTRHNVGFAVLDQLVVQTGLPQPVSSSKYAGRVSEGVLTGNEVTLLYPDTYMNKSGSAVQKLVPKDAVKQLIVVYDDVDIGVGDIKVSAGRGAGGHNGIQSIINTLGSKDFVRVRIGVAPRSFWTGEAKRPRGSRMSSHVLGQFSRKESAAITAASEQAIAAISLIMSDGPEAAMQRYN